MHLFKITILLFVYIWYSSQATQGIYEAPSTSFPSYGVPFNGFPSYDERSVNLLINMYRVAPTTVRDTFLTTMMNTGDTSYGNVFQGTNPTFPAQKPIVYNYNLNRAARAHSNDVNLNCANTLTHNDCNGTIPSDRIKKFASDFSNSQYGGENFINSNALAGYTLCSNFKKIWPILSSSSFVCEGTYSTNCVLNKCQVDTNTSYVGHRRNIMSATNLQVSAGNVWNANGKTGVLTHDFSYSAIPTVYSQVRIISGSHLWSTKTANANDFTFYAVVYLKTGDTFGSLKVYYNGGVETMTLFAGSNSVGIFKSTVKTQAAGQCHTYHFTLTYNGATTQNFPATGNFQTVDQTATCIADWVNEVNTRSLPSQGTASQGTADVRASTTTTTTNTNTNTRPFFQNDSEKVIFALAIVVTVLVVGILVVLLVRSRKQIRGNYSEPLLN